MPIAAKSYKANTTTKTIPHMEIRKSRLRKKIAIYAGIWQSLTTIFSKAMPLPSALFASETRQRGSVKQKAATAQRKRTNSSR